MSASDRIDGLYRRALDTLDDARDAWRDDVAVRTPRMVDAIVLLERSAAKMRHALKHDHGREVDAELRVREVGDDR